MDLPFLDPFHGSAVIRSNILFRLLDVVIYIPTAVLRSHARFHLNVSVQDVYLLDEVIYIYPLRGSAVLRPIRNSLFRMSACLALVYTAICIILDHPVICRGEGVVIYIPTSGICCS